MNQAQSEPARLCWKTDRLVPDGQEEEWDLYQNNICIKKAQNRPFILIVTLRQMQANNVQKSHIKLAVGEP